MKRISKTILILAIGAWTGNGANMLNAATPSRTSRTEVAIKQRRPRPERPMQREHIMNDRDFQFLYKTIKKKSFAKDRLELLSVGVLDNYFSCRQCARIMSLYSFDDDKLEVLDIMANHFVDMENADMILKSFKFDSGRRKAIDMMRVHKK